MVSDVFQIHLHDLKGFGRIPVDKFPPLLPDLVPESRGDLLSVSPEDMPDCPRRNREAFLLFEIRPEPLSSYLVWHLTLITLSSIWVGVLRG